MNVILNNILVEWSYRVSNGTPNPSNEEHLLILRDIILEKGINEKDVNSFIYRIKNGRVVLGEAKFLKNIVSKLKRVWTSFKSKIKSLFSKKLKGLGPGQETIITIPGLKIE
jgi:hypothetical protein